MATTMRPQTLPRTKHIDMCATIFCGMLVNKGRVVVLPERI